MKAPILSACLFLAGCAYQPPQPAVPLEVGMDVSRLTQYYGSPHHINTSSYGDQWVYQTTCMVGRLFQETLYVYVESGLVTGWQQYACR